MSLFDCLTHSCLRLVSDIVGLQLPTRRALAWLECIATLTFETMVGRDSEYSSLSPRAPSSSLNQLGDCPLAGATTWAAPTQHCSLLFTLVGMQLTRNILGS